MSVPLILLSLGVGDQVGHSLHDVDANEIDPTDAFASFRLHTDGHRYDSNTSVISYIDRGPFVIPEFRADQYEAMFTVTSGVTPTGSATGVWLAMTSIRTWTVSQTSVGVSQCLFTLDYRRASDSVIVATVAGNRLRVNVDV